MCSERYSFDIYRLCVTHKKPLLPESWYDACISLGEFQPESQFHVRQLDRFWHEARPIAYGAAGSYVLPTALATFSKLPDRVEISTYRKRILGSPVGRESRTHAPMRELDSEVATTMPELAPPNLRSESGFLIAQPVHFKSVGKQYASVHHRRDIRNYVSLAIQMGVLDKKSAAELLAAQTLIPGGIELGIYPTDWLTRTMAQLELVGREFLYRYGRRVSRYDNYQVRAVGFLSERLGSFLLLRHLRSEFSGSIPDDIFGHMTNIVEGGGHYSTGKAD